MRIFWQKNIYYKDTYNNENILNKLKETVPKTQHVYRFLNFHPNSPLKKGTLFSLEEQFVF